MKLQRSRSIPTYPTCRWASSYVLIIAHLHFLDDKPLHAFTSYEVAVRELDLLCRHLVLG